MSVEGDINKLINDRAAERYSSWVAQNPEKAPRGSGVGWHEESARSRRTAMHDLNSGRMTTAAVELLPVGAQELWADANWIHARHGVDTSDKGEVVNFAKKNNIRMRPGMQEAAVFPNGK